MTRIRACVRSVRTSDATLPPVGTVELLTLVTMQSPEVISAVLQGIRVPGTARAVHDSESVEVDVLELGSVIVEQPPSYHRALLSSLFKLTQEVRVPGEHSQLAWEVCGETCSMPLPNNSATPVTVPGSFKLEPQWMMLQRPCEAAMGHSMVCHRADQMSVTTRRFRVRPRHRYQSGAVHTGSCAAWSCWMRWVPSLVIACFLNNSGDKL